MAYQDRVIRFSEAADRALKDLGLGPPDASAHYSSEGAGLK
jgi:hypothetical protein